MSIDHGELRNLYAGLLNEMRVRRLVVSGLLEQHDHDGERSLPDFAAYELCYLQLRMLCELIALACLAAHGDIKETRTSKLLKTYEPVKIIKVLTALHPDFFPVPVQQGPPPPGSTFDGTISHVTEPYLTKSDLLSLHYQCGAVLHRGSTRNLAPLPPMKFEKIRSWHDKIARLLKAHTIQLYDPDWQIWGLSNADGTGLSQVSLFRRAG